MEQLFSFLQEYKNGKTKITVVMRQRARVAVVEATRMEPTVSRASMAIILSLAMMVSLLSVVSTMGDGDRQGTDTAKVAPQDKDHLPHSVMVSESNGHDDRNIGFGGGDGDCDRQGTNTADVAPQDKYHYHTPKINTIHRNRYV